MIELSSTNLLIYALQVCTMWLSWDLWVYFISLHVFQGCGRYSANLRILTTKPCLLLLEGITFRPGPPDKHLCSIFTREMQNGRTQWYTSSLSRAVALTNEWACADNWVLILFLGLLQDSAPEHAILLHTPELLSSWESSAYKALH